MITTLDAQPQECMEGHAHLFHTVAACHFQSVEHVEHWINKLVPRDKNGAFIKWSGGRKKDETRARFMENCVKHAHEIDFSVDCVSTEEERMSWFAWVFYMQNKNFISQRPDHKQRNCLVFKIGEQGEIAFPVLQASYLIWYHQVIRYLADVKNIRNKVLSDQFPNDELGPGEGKAIRVSFVNYLLEQAGCSLRVGLPVKSRYRELDRLSDYFCGWVNSNRYNASTTPQSEILEKLQSRSNPFIECVVFETDISVFDPDGNDITEAVKAAVVLGAAPPIK